MNRKAALAQSLIVGFEHPEPDALLERLITSLGIGGVILFSRNLGSPEDVWRLNNELQLMARKSGHEPLLVMVDQEGGSVARLKKPFTHEPDLCEMGNASEQDMFRHGRQMGRELVAAGFNWNLAPVMDVHANNDGVMARRSLGADPEQVARLAVAYAKGLMSAGCLACAKHFPGLGRTSLDTHKLGVMVELSRHELDSMELKPFAQAINAHIPGVLVSHATFKALDAAFPASLSKKTVTGLLREEMGFQGLILTDDLEMGAIGLTPAQAACQAYLAGNDLLLICRQNQQAEPALELLLQAAMEKRFPPARVEQTWARIGQYKSGLPAQPALADLQKIFNMRSLHITNM